MDLIDRQAAIDEFGDVKFDVEYCTEYGIGYNDGIDFAVSRLSMLPSAQKTGHWIMKEKVYDGLIWDSVYRYECSECGFSDEHNSSREVPFCWHCGARMESE